MWSKAKTEIFMSVLHVHGVYLTLYQAKRAAPAGKQGRSFSEPDLKPAVTDLFF